MEDKDTLAQIAAYARRVAQQVTQTAYAKTPALDGPALQSLTPVRALNLLVLHGLFGQWQSEARRMRSPYFDYEAAPVQQALHGLLNTLSRHIQVRAVDLTPLVEHAVTDALTLALDPAAAYERRFLPTDQPTLTAEALRGDLKYIVFNKPLFEDFVTGLPNGTLDRQTVVTRLNLHVRAHYKEATPPDALLKELSQVLPVSMADLRKPAAPVAAPAPAAPANSPQPENRPAPVAPPAAPAPAPKPVPPAPVAQPAAPAPPPAPAPAPPAPEAPKMPAFTPTPPQAASAPAPAPPPAPKAPMAPMEGSPATPLHEKFRADKVTLNDQLRHKDHPVLAEVLETKAKVESLEKAISINQRYTFISELFDGDRDAYNSSLKQLDAMSNAAQARDFVNSGKMSQGHNWVGKEEHVDKLLKLIDRKFS